MSPATLEQIVTWGFLILSIEYAGRAVWQWRHDRTDRYAVPLWNDLFGPVVMSFVVLIRDGNVIFSIATVALFLGGGIVRLMLRKRLGIPAWPRV